MEQNEKKKHFSHWWSEPIQSSDFCQTKTMDLDRNISDQFNLQHNLQYDILTIKGKVSFKCI